MLFLFKSFLVNVVMIIVKELVIGIVIDKFGKWMVLIIGYNKY